MKMLRLVELASVIIFCGIWNLLLCRSGYHDYLMIACCIQHAYQGMEGRDEAPSLEAWRVNTCMLWRHGRMEDGDDNCNLCVWYMAAFINYHQLVVGSTYPTTVVTAILSQVN